MTVTTAADSVTLYYKAGSSDKVYQAAVEPAAGGASAGYVVNFAFGRRGSTLQTGTKTASPVDYVTARKILDKLVAEKTAKGYTPGASGTPYQDTPQADRATGVLPQLLNAIADEEAQRLLADPAWWAQEKLDGKRVLVQRRDDQVIGINRSGLVIALPESIAACAGKLGGPQWLVDGEAIGETLLVFDLLECAGKDLRPRPYSQRLEALYTMLPSGGTSAVRSIPTASTPGSKQALLARLQQEHREGIVFKRHDAPYNPGRPASGGAALKFKFTVSASCLVARVNGSKRSVALELFDGLRKVGVGNVTVPANQPIPPAGSIVEARYLYAYPGGALYQPVLLGVRDDLAAEACTVAQLKFKASQDETDVEA